MLRRAGRAVGGRTAAILFAAGEETSGCAVGKVDGLDCHIRWEALKRSRKRVHTGQLHPPSREFSETPGHAETACLLGARVATGRKDGIARASSK